MPIMTLPFLYRAELVAPRKRNGDHVTVSGRMPVDVPEVPAREAPVAVVRMGADGKPAQAGISRHEWDRTRWWGGRHYTRIVRVDGSGIGAGDFADMARAPMDRPPLLRRRVPSEWDWTRFPALRGQGVVSHMDPSPLSTRSVEGAIRYASQDGRGTRRVKADDRAAREAEAAALYPEALLVVDGEVWCSAGVSEPRWSVFRGEEAVRVFASVIGGHSLGRHDFRADRQADALAWAHALADDGMVVDVRDVGMEIVEPASLAARDALSCALQIHMSAPLVVHALCIADVDSPELDDILRAIKAQPTVDGPSDPDVAGLLRDGRVLEEALSRAGVPCPDALAGANRRWSEFEACLRPDIAVVVDPDTPHADRLMQGFAP